MLSIEPKQLSQNFAEIQRQAQQAPVMITEQGKPAMVLMDYATYQQLTKPAPSLADAIGYSVASGVDFAPQRMDLSLRDFDE